MSDHFKYEQADRRTAGHRHGGLRAVLNEGHDGSVLNCSHPACVAIRKDDRIWGSTSDNRGVIPQDADPINYNLTAANLARTGRDIAEVGGR